MKTIKILLAEDDEDFGFVLKQYLEFEQFSVEWFRNPEEILALKNYDFDLAILDVMMPKIDGFSLAQKILGEKVKLPFLFLTAKNQQIDRIMGLKIGAQDYIAKPCDPEELVLRIRNILKRNSFPLSPPKEIAIGKYIFNLEKLLLIHPKETFRLTQKEADLLFYLVQNNHQLVKRKEILENIWQSDDFFSGRSMDVFISRIRKMLIHEKNISINSVRGIGFQIEMSS